jgi:hypothetical protein
MPREHALKQAYDATRAQSLMKPNAPNKKNIRISPVKRSVSNGTHWLERHAVLVYAITCAVLVLAHQARLLELVFFAGAIAVSLLLIRYSFARHLSFVIWLYFIAPEVRRLADFYKGEFSERSLIMLAPLVAAIMCAAYLPANRAMLLQRRGVPVLLVGSGILYGFAVGVVRTGIFAASYDLVAWTFPLMLACAIIVKWDRFDEMRDSVTRTFLTGGIVIAAYGLIQYINPPAWDAFWIDNAGMLTQGVAEPFGLRIFGPMNSSGPYSVALMCCALVALCTRGRLALLCLALCMPALFLTLVRSTLGGLAIGVLFLALSLTGKQRRVLFAGIVATMLAVVPLTMMEQSENGVTQRLATVTDLKDDASFEARSGIYDRFLDEMQVNVLGSGLGATGVGSKLASGPGGIVDFDSGVLEVPYVLGWPGSILYGAGIVLFIARAVSASLSRQMSAFACACAACSIGVVSLMVFTNTLVGASGLFFFVPVVLPGVERRFRQARAAQAQQGHAYTPAADALKAEGRQS